MVIQDFWAGGEIPPDLRHFLQGGSPGEPLVWIGDLVDDTQDREDPWRIPPQVGPPSGVNANNTVHGGTVLLPASGCSNGSGGA